MPHPIFQATSKEGLLLLSAMFWMLVFPLNLYAEPKTNVMVLRGKQPRKEMEKNKSGEVIKS